MTNTEKGRSGEKSVVAWLRSKGMKASLTKYAQPYDMLVNGWRCEVKTATMNSDGVWLFNIHRHGKLNEAEVDFYILVLEGVPFCKAAIYIIKKAPISSPTVSISVRSLIIKHSMDVHNISGLIQKPKLLQRKK